MAAPRPVSQLSAAEPDPVRVERIGADGDGIAAGPGGKPLYLAGTLPGELVQPGPLIKRGGGFFAGATVMEPSPDRVAPPCPHFGPCGGCTLQHWGEEAYARWKAGLVGAALRTDLPPLARTAPGTRRRIDLAIQREGRQVRIGLHRRRSPEVVDMHACPILHPALFRVVQALRPVLLELAGLRREGSAVLNLLESGPDLLLRTDADLSAADRARLAGFARAQGMPRVSWARGNGPAEPAASLRPAIHTLGGWETELPPGAFLQASSEGEQAIVEAVLAALPAKPKLAIIELFAGAGSLTHALSARGRVTAYEGAQAAVTALRRAGNPKVTAVQRDLARQPLQAAELKGAGAVVLDPPYAGAAAQMPALAVSGAPVIYVSCNPAALARDSRPLLAAGYRLASLAGIDQFLWSSQVESVAAFRRD
ncbi:MAG: class I SAM-dependent RNA methyltransferase [Acetobacteraceae bacterium]|nr:class I SAM-dependent RNA methyltransferase [Acetobacteraceae bacterium]